MFKFVEYVDSKYKSILCMLTFICYVCQFYNARHIYHIPYLFYILFIFHLYYWFNVNIEFGNQNTMVKFVFLNQKDVCKITLFFTLMANYLNNSWQIQLITLSIHMYIWDSIILIVILSYLIISPANHLQLK